MVYHFLKGVREKRWSQMILSSMAAALAFAVKAPYAFYFVLPMLVFVAQNNAWRFFLKTCFLFVLAFIPFYGWQQHATAVNSAMPDLGYILHYRKMVNNAHWYFGNLVQRLDLYHWKVLLLRGMFDVAGPAGLVLLVWGVWKNKNSSGTSLFWAWAAGLALYVLVFFNLNAIHDYYQIPLLAPVAVGIAWGLERLRRPWYAFALLALSNIACAEFFYYKTDPETVAVARVIRENTPPDALVIVTNGTMDCRDPRILYRADRRGWSVQEAAVKPGVIERLHREQGAQVWAYVGEKAPPWPGEARVFPLQGSLKKVYLKD
jgi:hypothetical protein